MKNSDNRILKNSSIAILYEILAVVTGLILPRLILVNFGSSDNGVINSVTQFLSFVVLIRSGIGGVAKVHLYKSIRENDTQTTSMVMRATKDYMNKVSAVFLAGLLVLAAIYPLIVSLDWVSTALLVLICGFSALTENYFGISSMILLQADRREYLISIGDIITTLLNAILSVILINCGFGIHIVRLGTALAFSVKPLFLFFYVKKKYRLEKNITYPKSLLNKKKDAFIHVVAEFIHRNTAIMVLTVFVGTLAVSVYSIYGIVINGMRRLTAACTANIESVLGKHYSAEDKSTFYNLFCTFEYCTFLLSGFIYTCCGCLFASFINVYTAGVTDTVYVLPLFAILLCIGEFFDLIKTPYQFVIRVAGHFKQTKWISVTEAVINVCISLILVHKYQLVGVAIGNAIAMLWRAVAYSIYVKKNITPTLKYRFLKYFSLCSFSVILSALLFKLFELPYAINYMQWFGQALLTAATTLLCITIANLLFCRNEFLSLLKKMLRLILKSIKKT